MDHDRVVLSLAKPPNAGVALLDGDGGRSSVTSGEAVSTVNVTGALVPASEARLRCVACAV